MLNSASSSHAPTLHGWASCGQYLPASSELPPFCPDPVCTVTQQPRTLGAVASNAKARHRSVPASRASSCLGSTLYAFISPDPPSLAFNSAATAALWPSASGIGGCAGIVFMGRYFELKGIAGIHLNGCSVHAKNGFTPSPSMVPGGYTAMSSFSGGDWPAAVGGAENVNRARCFAMFQFKRPLYVVVRCETYIRQMRNAFLGIFGTPPLDGGGTVKFPGTMRSSSYVPF